MRTYVSILLVSLFALLVFGCSDPAANKPKASVGNAAPESPESRGRDADYLTRQFES